MPKCKTCGKGRVPKFFCSWTCRQKYKVAFFAGCQRVTNWDTCKVCSELVPRNYMITPNKLKTCNPEQGYTCRTQNQSLSVSQGKQRANQSVWKKRLNRYKKNPDYREQIRMRAAEAHRKLKRGTLF